LYSFCREAAGDAGGFFCGSLLVAGHSKKRPPQQGGGKWQTCQNVFCQKTLAKLPGLRYTN
jgi:hypothetical protein